MDGLIASEGEAHDFEMLLNNFNGMAFKRLLNPHWTMTYLSQGCENLTGYPPEVLMNNGSISFMDLILESDRDYLKQKNLEARSAKKTAFEKYKISLEYSIRHKNGALIYVSEESVPVFNAQGEVIFFARLYTEYYPAKKC